jgi:hypothetical protein
MICDFRNIKFWKKENNPGSFEKSSDYYMPTGNER